MLIQKKILSKKEYERKTNRKDSFPQDISFKFVPILHYGLNSCLIPNYQLANYFKILRKISFEHRLLYWDYFGTLSFSYNLANENKKGNTRKCIMHGWGPFFNCFWICINKPPKLGLVRYLLSGLCDLLIRISPEMTFFIFIFVPDHRFYESICWTSSAFFCTM